MNYLKTTLSGIAVMSLGGSFIYLGISRYSGDVIDKYLLLGITISVLCFSFADLFLFIMENIKENKSIFNKILSSILEFGVVSLIFLAIYFIILLPQDETIRNIDDNQIALISESITLITFGIYIALLGYKQFSALRSLKKEILKPYQVIIDKVAKLIDEWNNKKNHADYDIEKLLEENKQLKEKLAQYEEKQNTAS